METNHYNPIRVYSALLEFNDMSSLRMYNKLHNMMINKKQRQRTKGQLKGQTKVTTYNT